MFSSAKKRAVLKISYSTNQRTLHVWEKLRNAFIRLLTSFKRKKLESLRHFLTILKIVIYFDFMNFPVDLLIIYILSHRYVFQFEKQEN